MSQGTPNRPVTACSRGDRGDGGRRGRLAQGVPVGAPPRKDEEGKFIWPGFGENSRVLEWVFRRTEGAVGAKETPLGLVPEDGALNVEGLDMDADALAEVLTVDPDLLREQLPQVKAFLDGLGPELPEEIPAQQRALKERLGA